MYIKVNTVIVGPVVHGYCNEVLTSGRDFLTAPTDNPLKQVQSVKSHIHVQSNTTQGKASQPEVNDKRHMNVLSSCICTIILYLPLSNCVSMRITFYLPKILR